MSNTYNVDSESDDEEDEETEIAAPIAKNSTWHLQDIEKLKEQTNELLDSKWKETRNKHLLSKMLDLEQPAITVKMVDFLLQDGVCECLLSFITQVGTGAPRPGPNDSHSEALKLSYRAVILLSPENPTEALNSFLSKKASTIARIIFDVFREDSAGSFYHAYRVLECLLRCFPADVYEGICFDDRVAERMGNMLAYAGCAPVCELVVMLVALTPIPRTSQLYTLSSKSRWVFFEEMSAWNLMLRIVHVLVSPEEHCVCSDEVIADQHSSAASQLLQELIEKLSLEDTGEILLQPLGYTTALLDALVDTTVDTTVADGLRRHCTRILCFLLRRAAEAEIMCFVQHPNGAPPAATLVANRLYPLRERIVNHIRGRIGDITSAIHDFEASSIAGHSGGDDGGSVGGGSTVASSMSIKFSSYEVQVPFSSLRSYIVELLALMVESDETVASLIPLELWKQFIAWALKYAHNNIYHALFYRLIFAVLRQGQEAPQRILFQKAKFALFLIDNFVGYQDATEFALENNPSLRGQPQYELSVRRAACRGLIMNCANAIRLQASCQTPDSFLTHFLTNHQKWNDFLHQLSIATDIQMRFGMGIKVASLEQQQAAAAAKNSAAAGLTNMMMFISEPKPTDEEIDHGSRFAKSLGFYEDAPWSFATPDPLAMDDIQQDRLKRRKKEKKNKLVEPSASPHSSISGNDFDDEERLSMDDDGRYSDLSDSADEADLMSLRAHMLAEEEAGNRSFEEAAEGLPMDDGQATTPTRIEQSAEQQLAEGGEEEEGADQESTDVE